MRAGRGTDLRGKFAVVTGAARGIGRAIAVEMALNGADIAAIDICGPVSTASDAKPATPADLDETVRQVRGRGRRCIRIEADIRDIGKLREAAAHIQQKYGRIDIVVADAAIQRWKPLLKMDDADWRDVIDNNLNGTANTIRAFAPIWSVSAMGGSSSCPRCKGSTGPKMQLILGIEVGHSRADEVGGHGVGSVRHHRQCLDTCRGGHPTNAIS